MVNNLFVPPFTKANIDLSRLPEHVAIIMDGNGRWAKQKGKHRIFGHHNGVIAVRESVEAAAEIGLKYLTLYAFSTENWSRPKKEVNSLMTLLIGSIHKETKTLIKNDIRLLAIGDIESLPAKCIQTLKVAIRNTEANKRMTLILALSYSSRWEIVNAVKQICLKVESGELKAAMVDQALFNANLSTAAIPDPSLLIRTSGEYRISNFLLWQLAYTELFFTETLWPDFRKNHLYEALADYQKRERRFGLTSEQMCI